MSSVIHPTKNFLAALLSGKKRTNTHDCHNPKKTGSARQATHKPDTYGYQKPVRLIIITLLFELQLSVYLYCTNYFSNYPY